MADIAAQFVKIRRRSPDRLARSHWGSGRAIQDHDTGARLRTVNVIVSEVEAPSWVASALAADLVACRERVFAVDGRRVMLSASYIPLDLARGTAMMEPDSGPGGVYARLAEAGWAPEWFDEDVTARPPAPNETADLDLTGDRPTVFEITRFAVAVSRDRVVEVNRMVADAEVYDLSYGFPA